MSSSTPSNFRDEESNTANAENESLLEKPATGALNVQSASAAASPSPAPTASSFSLWQSIFYMAFNFISSVSIISINKIVLGNGPGMLNFRFSTLLTAVHFFFTTLGLLICAKVFKMFEIVWIPLSQILPLSLTFIGFVVFNNLSLQYNSLGFYQLMKVMTTPVLVVLQYYLYGVEVDSMVKLSLLPICVGVILASVNDVQMNVIGFIYALLGIGSTSLYQLYVKAKQGELKLNSYQLLFLQAPSSMVLVLFISLFTEPVSGPSGWMTYPHTSQSIFYIILSSMLAFLVNLSIFLVIGKTSPLAYNVLGHFKLVVILLSGFLLFQEEINLGKSMGILLTLIGVITYTHLQQTRSNGWDKKKETNANSSK